MVLVLIAVGSVASCGKKGDPTPVPRQPPAGIRGLTATATADGVLLEWTLKAAPAPDSAEMHIQLWRARRDPGKDVCPGGPKDYLLLIKAPAADFAGADGKPGSCRYLDRTAARGARYDYRIELGAPGGAAIASSPTVGITFKP